MTDELAAQIKDLLRRARHMDMTRLVIGNPRHLIKMDPYGYIGDFNVHGSPLQELFGPEKEWAQVWNWGWLNAE